MSAAPEPVDRCGKNAAGISLLVCFLCFFLSLSLSPHLPSDYMYQLIQDSRLCDAQYPTVRVVMHIYLDYILFYMILLYNLLTSLGPPQSGPNRMHFPLNLNSPKVMCCVYHMFVLYDLNVELNEKSSWWLRKTT
jgi:hypothetical protein